MDKSISLLTAAYARWLESFMALIPGLHSAGPSSTLARKEGQVAANEEWEGEGGTVRAMDPAARKAAPKIPL